MRRTVVAGLLSLFVLSCDSEGPITPDPRVATILVVPAADTVLLASEPVRFTATAKDATGAEVVGAKFLWKSSAPAVATVDANGLVLGIGAGSATITASNGSREGQASVLVNSFTVLAGVGACAAAGTNHSAAIDEPTTWTRATSPHHVLRTISVRNTLTIEPGAVVCGYPNVELSVLFTSICNGDCVLIRGVLMAQGTAAQPIVFTAQDPAQVWSGIYILGSTLGPAESRISHALIEYAFEGVNGEGPVTVDSSHIRQIDGWGVALTSAEGRVAHSVIDTAGRAGNYAGIYMIGGTAEDNLIRGSGSGIMVGNTANRVTINGGRIEGSSRIGLVVSNQYSASRIVAGRPVRIVGGKSSAVSMAMSDFLVLYPRREDQDSLLGNANNTLRLGKNLSGGELVVRKDLPWVISGSAEGADVTLGGGGTIRMEPGASIQMDSRMVVNGGRLVARGTAAEPVSISGGGLIMFSGTPSDTTYLSYAHVKTTRIITADARALVIEHTTMSDGTSIELRSRGSRITDSVIDGGASNDYFEAYGKRLPLASIVLGAPGISMTQTLIHNSATHGVVVDSPGVTINSCAVSGSNGDAVRVTASGAAAIHACNFEENAGAGVNNLGSTAVDAIDNWWGDTAGPTGPNGDGVAGNVNYQPYRTSPSATGTAVNRVVIRTAPPTVATADTTRYVAEAQDANGNAILPELIGWRTADSSIVVVDANGLVTGLKVGSTQLVAYARSDPAKQSSTTVRVVAGALVLKWRKLANTGITSSGALWAVSANYILVGTTTGVARMDSTGRIVTPEMAGTHGYPIVGIWGNSPNDIWAVGSATLHFDGVAWTVASPFGFQSISGSGPDDVYAGGQGDVFHLDGTTWRSTNLGKVCRVLQVRARGDVFGLCDNLVYHYDGVSWTDLHSPIIAYGLRVSATSVTVVGSTADHVGKSAQWDGVQWITADMRNAREMTAVTGFSDSSLFATGEVGAVRYFDGTTWYPVWTGLNLARSFAALTIGGAVYLVSGTGTGDILRGTR